MVNRTRVEGGGYSKHDIVTSVEVLALCLLVGKNLYIYCVSNWENEHLLVATSGAKLLAGGQQ